MCYAGFGFDDDDEARRTRLRRIISSMISQPFVVQEMIGFANALCAVPSRRTAQLILIPK